MTYRTRTLVRASVGLVALCGLLLFVYFGVYRTKKDQERAEQIAKLVFDFDQAQVTQVVVEQGEERTVCSRSGIDPSGLPGWTLAEPVRGEADNIAVNALLGTLQRLEFESRITGPDAESLPRYGLDNFRGKITLSTTGGRTLALRVGKENSSTKILYVQREGEKDVLVIRTQPQPLLLKGTFDLRRKELLRFETEQVSRLVLNDGRTTIELETRGKTWRIRSPIEDEADSNEVNTVLNMLRNMQAVSFPPPEQLVLKALGFEPPALTVEIQTGTETAQTLEFGVGASESHYGRYFGRRKNPPGPLAEIRQYQLKGAQKSVFDLQAKTPLEFDPAAVSKIKLAGDTELIVLEKKVTKKAREEVQSVGAEESWFLVSPLAAPAKGEEVRALLERLANLRATRFLGDKERSSLEPLGLQKPTRTISLYDKDGEEIGNLKIGRTTDGTCVMGTSRRQVCLVDKKEIEQLPANAKDLLDDTFAQEKGAEATKTSDAGTEKP